MPRYVLLRHERPPALGKPSHWDLMLEHEGALLTWSVTELPAADGGTAPAKRLADHRIAYLDYEGPLSAGRGDVRRVDAGELAWIAHEPDSLSAEIDGSVLRGVLRLELVGEDLWLVSLGSTGRAGASA